MRRNGDSLVLNLQLFAGEKTEKATPKRRQEARKQGQVIKSRDLTSALILATGFVALKVFGPFILNKIIMFYRYIFIDCLNKHQIFTIQGMANFTKIIFGQFLMVSAPFVMTIFAISIASNIMQTGFMFSTEPLMPKADRINPIEGFKRIFSKRAIVELMKALFKIGLVGYITFSSISNRAYEISLFPCLKVAESLTLLGDIMFSLAIKVSVVLIILGGLDYFFQWWEHEKNLMMTKQETKEEFKQTEGDPSIKGRVRQIQRKLAMSRMMQKVPQADVIITNPDHLAVALKYDSQKNSAPQVIAKGANYIAQKIKDTAQKSNVPIVENKPLAQVLYQEVEIGDIIPTELYQAVAEVLAYVYSLKP